MNGATTLASVSAVMFVGSYLAALLPQLVQSSSPFVALLINAGGAGLLLGAALCVVLPEGFITFAEAQEAFGEDSRYPEWLLGLALLLGFMAMIALQAVAEHLEHKSQDASPVDTKHLETEDSQNLEPAPLLAETNTRIHPLEVFSRSSSSPSLTAVDQALYGLVVHAAADGIAIGAACLSNSLALTASIAGAILVHKFPVAFGLSSYLRSSGWQGMKLQKGLLMFCSAAPLAAIFMYLILGNFAAMNDSRNVALCLLFSGGTVLHAGLVHVLPSVLQNGEHEGHGHTHNSGGGARNVKKQRPHERMVVMSVLALSSLIPLVISALIPEAE